MPESTARLFSDASPEALLETLLEVSLTGVIFFEPIYTTDGTSITDLSYRHLNPAAQRMLQLPLRPAETFLTLYPNALQTGIFAFYRDTFLSGKAGRYDVNYSHDVLDNYFHLSAQPSGQLLVVSFSDTSHQDRTHVEVALRESQARERENFYQVFEQAPVIVALLRGPKHLLYYRNPAFQALFPGRKLTGHFYGDVMPEIVAAGLMAELDKVYATGETYYGTELPVITSPPDGSAPHERYYDFSYQTHREGGEIVGISIFAYDVTERVLARQIVEAQRAELQRVFEQAPVAIAIYRGPELVIELANSAIAKLWGRPVAPLLGQPLFEALPDARGQGFEELFADLLGSGVARSFLETPVTLVRKPGETPTLGYYNFTYQPLPEAPGMPAGFIAVGIDVTEQVQSRLEREAQQRKLYTLFEQAPAGICILAGPDLVFEFLNPGYQELLPGRQLLGRPVLEALPELVGTEVEVLLRRVYQTGETQQVQDMLIPVARPGGNGELEDRYFTFVYQARRDEQGLVNGILDFVFEVTEQVRARRKVEESEQDLRNLVLAAPMGICLLEGQTLMVEIVNEHFVEVAGRPAEAIVGKWYWEAFAEVRSSYESALQGVVETGETYYANEVELMLIRHGKEEIVYVTFVYQAMKDREGKVKKVVVYVLENTPQVVARKRVEESQQQVQAIIESASSPLAVYLGKEMRVLFANQAMKEAFGKGPDVAGKVYRDILPELANQEIFEQLEGVFQTGKPFHSRNQPFDLLIDGQLQTHYYTYSFTPLFNDAGQVYGIVNTASNVTDLMLAQQSVERYAHELQQSEQRFRLFVQASNDTLYRMSPDWQQMLALEGKNFLANTDEAKSTWIDEYLPPEDQARALEAIQEATRTKGIFALEHRVIKADGSTGWTFSRAIPVLDQAGEIVEWFGAASDITEQKLAKEALQESEQRFRIMADASPTMIWALDPDSSLKYANAFMLVFLGISLDKFIVHNWVPYLHADDLKQTVHIIREAIEKRKPFRNEHRFLCHDGEYRWLLSQGAPSYFPNGDLYGYVGSSIDITEIKEAEIKLQHYAQELAAANEELSAANEDLSASRNELEKSNAYLQRVNSDLDNFIYTASHDLKAPINNIEGLMQVLMQKMERKGLPDPLIGGILQMIEASIARFKGTVTGLAEIAKAENQLDLAAETVDVAQIVSDILLDLRTPIEQAGAVIEQQLNACPQLTFSGKNLKSIFYNLISNAIKYRHPDRPPWVRISCHSEEEYLVVSVQDNGLGLNTRDENKVFGMFQRQHRHVEGTGVGLYIVKKIVENAGGKITVESTLGQGSLFKVYVKQAQQSSQV